MHTFLSQWLSLAHKKFISPSTELRNNVTRRIGNFTSPKNKKFDGFLKPSWKFELKGKLNATVGPSAGGINFKCHWRSPKCNVKRFEMWKTGSKWIQIYSNSSEGQNVHQTDHSRVLFVAKGNLGHWGSVLLILNWRSKRPVSSCRPLKRAEHLKLTKQNFSCEKQVGACWIRNPRFPLANSIACASWPNAFRFSLFVWLLKRNFK